MRRERPPAPMDDERRAMVLEVWDEFGRTLRRCIVRTYPRLGADAHRHLGPDGFEAACLRGLCMAASRFESARECKLITYALQYMRNETQRDLALARGQNSRGGGLRMAQTVYGSESQEEMSLSELAEAPPAEGPEVAESRAAVRQQVERLSPQLRQVVMHRYFFGLTLREAADRMGVSREMVRQLEMQALNHLKQRLAEDQS